MFLGLKKPVYITRNTDSRAVAIWDTEIGIAKFEGCVEYYSGNTIQANRKFNICERWDNGLLSCLCSYDCIKEFGSFPGRGEAWLVEERKNDILWTRVDHNMHLLSPKTGEIIEEGK
jgi:hypothetical protein